MSEVQVKIKGML